MDARYSGTHYRNRDREIREHVTTLVKYLEHVIHDIKYVVVDLQVLLQQIDLVTRQLDEPFVPVAGVAEENARYSHVVTSSLPPRQEYHPTTNTLLARSTTLPTNPRRTSRSQKSKKHPPIDCAAASSNTFNCSSDGQMQRRDDDGFEFDRSSLEFNAMWDTEYDKDLISTQFEGDNGQQLNECLGKLESSFPSWTNNSLEQSLTSGIDMLTFTDDSEEDDLVFGQQRDNKCNIAVDFLTVDPNHVCCKDVILLGSGSTYCGVYEAVLDSCLESCVDITRSDSFTSPAYISEDEELESVHSGCSYEARYNAGINPWTAFTMAPLGSVHSSEDDISETSSDILNDNILPTLVLDNMDTKSNDNVITTDITKTSGSAETHHMSFLVC